MNRFSDQDLNEMVMLDQIKNEKYGKKYNGGIYPQNLPNYLGEMVYEDALINKERRYRDINYQRAWENNNFRIPDFNGYVLPDREMIEDKNQKYYSELLKKDFQNSLSQQHYHDKYTPQYMGPSYFSDMWNDGESMKKSRSKALANQKQLKEQFEFDVKEATGQESFSKGLQMQVDKQNKARFNAYNNLTEENAFDDQIERQRYMKSKAYKLLSPEKQKDELKRRDDRLLKLLNLHNEVPQVVKPKPYDYDKLIKDILEEYDIYTEKEKKAKKKQEKSKKSIGYSNRYNQNMFIDDIIDDIKPIETINPLYGKKSKVSNDIDKLINKKPLGEPYDLDAILKAFMKPKKQLINKLSKERLDEGKKLLLDLKNKRISKDAYLKQLVEEALNSTNINYDDDDKKHKNQVDALYRRKAVYDSDKNPNKKENYTSDYRQLNSKSKFYRDSIKNNIELKSIAQEEEDLQDRKKEKQNKKDFEEAEKKKKGKGRGGSNGILEMNMDYFKKMYPDKPHLKEQRKKAFKTIAKRKYKVKKEKKIKYIPEAKKEIKQENKNNSFNYDKLVKDILEEYDIYIKKNNK